MSKLVRRLMFLLGVGVIGATSFGYSYFYFENTRSQSTDANTFKVDDIQENYPFGKTTSNTTYTLYFFPNAAYMHLYYEYLEKGAVAPELQFGYKEVQYNEVGNVLTDDNGNARYKLSDLGQYSESSYDNTKITYDGAFRKYIGTKFSNNYFEADGGEAYNDSGAFMTSYYALSLSEKRTWGEPGEDFTIYQGVDGREEKYNGHNQYSLDRLGCWDKSYYYGKTVRDSSGDGAITGFINENNDKLNDTNTGRYLPIKITVTNTLSMSIYEAAIQDLFASMGNSKDWHNYSFTEWTYVYKDSDGNYVYPYSHLDNTEASDKTSGNVGEAFQPKEVETYFDIFSDLDKYADDNNVIRLFPMFSNGKKIPSKEKKTTGSDVTLLNGGGATQKLQITYGDDNVYKYPLFTNDVYNDGSGYFTYGDDSTEETLLNSEYIRLFSYNNIEIKSSSNISSIKFSANNVWGETKEKAVGNWNSAPSDSPHWSGLFWGSLYLLDSDYIQKELISKYGEGLYTFYIFVANYSYQNGPGSGTSNSEASLKGTFDSFYNNIVSQATSGKFSSLKNKNLVQIEYVESNYHDGYKCSPTVVAFEKIDEPKAIRDYPSNGATDNESTINSFISSKYSLAPGFYRSQDYLYEGNKSGETYSYKDTTNLAADRPYTYIARDVDFMDMENQSLYFMIAFGDTYTTHNSFSETYSYDYLITSGSEITDTTTAITETSNVFTKASEYMDVVDVTDSSDSSKKYQMFKFKDLEHLGVYDILITCSKDSINSTNNTYEIYMYRHSNIFCKVFDEKLDAFEAGKFVDHEYDSTTYKTSSGATLLFQKQYFLGQSISATDISIAGTNAGKTLDQCLRLYISNIEGETASDTYSDAKLINYRILDRITDSVVAKYIPNSDGTYKLECDFKISKNYVFYIDKCV